MRAWIFLTFGFCFSSDGTAVEDGFHAQLGRGLRLCTGKDRVRVLDFIGTIYIGANQVRKYLAKESTIAEETDDGGRKRKKIAYVYSPGCEVKFSAEVEEILARQDTEELGIDKDLKEAYFALAQRLERKPTRSDLDEYGEYKSALYVGMFGGWAKFLREVGEYTEASYHYPQGTHLGHVLSVLWFFGLPARARTHLDNGSVESRRPR